MTPCADTSATSGAFINIVGGMNPTQADFRFQVPMFAQEPAIAICQADTTNPSLVAMIFQNPEISTQEFEISVEMTHIGLPEKGVKPYEMAAQSLAKPIACLGLSKPVLPPLKTTTS